MMAKEYRRTVWLEYALGGFEVIRGKTHNFDFTIKGITTLNYGTKSIEMVLFEPMLIRLVMWN